MERLPMHCDEPLSPTANGIKTHPHATPTPLKPCAIDNRKTQRNDETRNNPLLGSSYPANMGREAP